MDIIPFLVDGLLIGFVYGIAAMGLTLIFGVMNVINLAHGPIIALGMFGVYLLSTGLGLTPYLALPIVAVAGLILGIVVYVVAIHRIIDAPHLSSLLATFAVNMIIIGLGTAYFTTNFRNVDFDLGSLSAGTVTVPWTRIVAALLSILVAGGLYLFLYRTTTGKYVRAVSNNRPAAELMGIPSARILALSFGIGSLLAAVAGGMIATFFPFTILSGGPYELKSFVIAVMGGLGNPLGALLGGLILGLLEGVVPRYIDFTWTPVIEFVLFVAILLYRPKGILGARQ